MPINAVNVVISTQLGAQLIWGFSFVVGVPLFIEKFSVAETTMPFLTLNHYQWIDGQERISMN